MLLIPIWTFTYFAYHRNLKVSLLASIDFSLKTCRLKPTLELQKKKNLACNHFSGVESCRKKSSKLPCLMKLMKSMFMDDDKLDRGRGLLFIHITSTIPNVDYV